MTRRTAARSHAQLTPHIISLSAPRHRLPARLARRLPLSLALTTLLVAAAPSHAAAVTWTGSAGDAKWSNTGNWQNGSRPGQQSWDELRFAGTRNLVSTNDLGLVYANGINFRTGSGAFTIGGNDLAVKGAVTSNSDQRQTFNAKVTAVGDTTLTGNIKFTTLALDRLDPQAAFPTLSTDGQQSVTNFIWSGGTVKYTDAAFSGSGLLSSTQQLSSGRTLDVNGKLVLTSDARWKLDGGTLLIGDVQRLGQGQMTWGSSGTLGIRGAAGAKVGNGLIDDGLSLYNGRNLQISKQLTVDAGRSLVLDGGQLSVGDYKVDGLLDWKRGALAVTERAVGVMGDGVLPKTMNLTTGNTLSFAQTLSVPVGSTLQVNDAALSAGVLRVDGGSAAFATQADGRKVSQVQLKQGRLSVGGAVPVQVGGPLVADGMVLSAGQTLAIDQTLLFPDQRMIKLDGGTLEVKSLDGKQPLAWTSGTLHFTGNVSRAGSGSPLPDGWVLGAGMNLRADGMFIVPGGERLVLDGGELSIGGVMGDSGMLTWKRGTLRMTSPKGANLENFGFVNALNISPGKELLITALRPDVGVQGMTNVPVQIQLAGGRVVIDGLATDYWRYVSNKTPLRLSKGTLQINDFAGAMVGKTYFADMQDLSVETGLNLEIAKVLSVPIGTQLSVRGGAVMAGSVRLEGGTLSYLNGKLAAPLDWRAGTLKLASSEGATWGSGLLSELSILGPQQKLDVTGQFTVPQGKTLTLIEGEIAVGALSVQGSFDWRAGGVSITGWQGGTAQKADFGLSVLNLNADKRFTTVSRLTVDSGAELRTAGGTLNTPLLVLDGGRIVGDLQVPGVQQFNWSKGEVVSTRTDTVSMGSATLLGKGLTTSADRRLTLAGPVRVGPGTYLAADGQASLTAPQLLLDGGDLQLSTGASAAVGSFVWTAGSLSLLDYRGVSQLGQGFLPAQLQVPKGMNLSVGGRLVVGKDTSLTAMAPGYLYLSELTVERGGVVTAGGGMAGSRIDHQGSINAANGGLSLAGSISGDGDFSGDITFLRNYAPGTEVASIDFHGGSAVFDAFSSLTLDINGTQPGIGHDQLRRLDSLKVRGQLRLVFGPSFGDGAASLQLFDVLRFDDALALAGIRVSGIDTQRLDLATFTRTGVLNVSAVPEPSSWALLLGGGLWLGWRGRSRLRSMAA